MALVYTLMFWESLLAVFYTARQLFQTNWRRAGLELAALPRTGYFFVRNAAPLLLVVVILGVWAGVGIGLWRLYTSQLSKGVKIGVSMAIFLPLLSGFLGGLYSSRKTILQAKRLDELAFMPDESITMNPIRARAYIRRHRDFL